MHSPAPVLFLNFEYVASFQLLIYTLVGLTGVLVGVEIPLLMWILKHRYPFKDLVARVFRFDYVGALLASLIFPLVLVPQLGLIRTALVFGALNLGVALPVGPASPKPGPTGGATARVSRRACWGWRCYSASPTGCWLTPKF